MDHATRWLEMVPLRRATAHAAARALFDRVVCRHGVPRRILSDRGTQFTSALWKKIAELLNVKLSTSTAYHPQTNGLLERYHRSLKIALKRCPPQSWDQFLPSFTFCHNTQVHSATRESPFYLLYGREATLPVDLIYGRVDTRYPVPEDEKGDVDPSLTVTRILEDAHRFAFEADEVAKKKSKKYYDRTRKQAAICEGDLVLLHNPAAKGLELRWTGPHRVRQVAGVNLAVQDMRNRREQVVHVARTKKFVPWPKSSEKEQQVCGTAMEEKQEPETYEVEEIRRHRKKKDGSWEFLIQWKDYPPEDNTWEPADCVPSRNVADYFTALT